MTPPGQLGGTVLDVMECWIAFRKTHHVEGIKFSCCEDSRALFASLDRFEKVMGNEIFTIAEGED